MKLALVFSSVLLLITPIVALGDTSLTQHTGAEAPTEDDQWWDGFGRAGTNGRIEALAVYRQDLIAGGNFGYAGSTGASHVARWNGKRWEPLRQGLGCPVHALAVYDGCLYSGGECEDRGWPADPCYHCVHRWDGVSWEPIGIEGTAGWPWPVIFTVDALQSYDGKLFAGGYFFRTEDGNPGDYLLEWDGEEWSPMDFSLNGAVTSMTVYDGKLIIGGKFTRVDTLTVNRIVAWDGETVSPLGTGMDARDAGDSIAVYALHVHNRRLIAGGDFTDAGGVAVDRLASWDGTSWTSLGFEAGEVADQYGPRVTALMTYKYDLVVGGVFDTAGGAPGDYIASWDGTGWEAVGAGMDGRVNTFIIHEGDLLTGGSFRFAGGVPVYHVAGWNSLSWYSLGPEGMGVSGWVRALAGDGERVFAGGEFDIAGSTQLNNIASWDGADWDSIGSGFAHPVREVAFCQGLLHGVAEPYRWIGSKLIKRWNGVVWEPFEAEFPNAVNVIVDLGGSMLVGGHDAAFWMGSSWESIGQAKKGHFRDFVVSGDTLFAGGYFPAILVGEDEVWAPAVAAWHEGFWHNLGYGLEGPHNWHEAQVYDLLMYRGDLVAAGKFRHSGDTQLRHVAMWNGTDWVSVGTGVNDRVYSLELYNGTLIAAGEFSEAGGIRANHVARWNGSEWSPLGSGVDSEVSCLWVQGGYLYVGGKFKLAGGRASYNIARWEDRFPGMVLSFRAASADTAIRLTWTNPPTDRLGGVLIRFSGEGYPAGPEKGRPLPNDNQGKFAGAAGRDMSFVHRGLGNGGAFYYTAFAYDEACVYSTPAHAFVEVPDVFAPELALSVLQNPYLTQYLDIYVVGSEALDPDSVELVVNDEVVEVTAVDSFNKVWQGDYKLAVTDDSVSVSACGYDCAHNQGCATALFRSSHVEGGAFHEVKSLDHRFSLVFDRGTPDPGTFVLILPCRAIASEEDASGLPGDGVLLTGRSEAPGGYRICPPGLLSDCTAHIEYGYTSDDLARAGTADRLHIEQDGVGPLACYVDRERRIVTAEIASTGTFSLRCGETASSEIMDFAFLDVGTPRPNPFSNSVSLRYEIRAPQAVSARIYDVRGREVVGLLETLVQPGVKQLTWHARDAEGRPVPSGVYFLKFRTDHSRATRKVTLIR